jgi:predicted lipoprotein with Yx(FWY)xxD motif
MRARWLVLLLVALFLLAACGGASDDTGGDEAAADSDTEVTEAEPIESEPAETSSADTGATTSESAGDGGGAIDVADSDLGEILVDGDGMTLYVFDNDTDENSTCYDDCAANWPAFTGDVSAGDGVDEGLIGASERDDGTMQVTYDRQPLYYFAGDQAAGDLNGQSVGGIWWVVGPDGQKITDEVSQTSTSDSGGY